MSDLIANLELMARYEALIGVAEARARKAERRARTATRRAVIAEEARKRAETAERLLREATRAPLDQEAKSLYADGVSTWWIARLLGLPQGVVRGMVRQG